MSSNVNTNVKDRSGNLANRRTSGRRLATVASASVAVLGFSAAGGITSAAASLPGPVS